MCLTYKRGTISKEQHILHPTVTHQHIYERNRHSCLARTCCHHEQSFAMLLVEVLTHRLDCHLLICSVGDMVFHREIRNILATALLNHQLQVACRVESKQSAWRITQTIYDVCLKSIGVIYHRSHAILLFQTISIQLCLMLALDWRYRCTLCLNNCKRFTIATKEYIIHITHLVSIWHTLNLNLYARLEWLNCTLCRIDVPSRLTQHQVNVHLASLCLRNIARNLYHRRCRLHSLLICCLYNLVRRQYLHICWHHHRPLNRVRN